MLLSLIITLSAALLTGLQAALIYYQGEGICFNEGCEVVDSLTLIPPFYFNIAGLIFFLLVSISIFQARKGSELWLRFASLLLLAAIAAEGVLFGFQYFITEQFCSYCLIILALVISANIFMGLKQIFRGLVIFTAIIIAFGSLDFNSSKESNQGKLDDGSLAILNTGIPQDKKLYLFFSSACTYCEGIIESIRENPVCSINFNPVDRLENFSFPGATSNNAYNPAVNVRYLKNLEINEVPVLAVNSPSSVKIFRGAEAISTFLNMECSAAVSLNQQVQPPPSITGVELPLLPQDDNCSVTEACEETSETTSNGQSLPQSTY